MRGSVDYVFWRYISLLKSFLGVLLRSERLVLVSCKGCVKCGI